jgi:hypothetical protein
MRQLVHLALVIGSSALALGCDNPYDDGLAIDPNAPRIHITSPARGTFAGKVNSIAVEGTVTDDQLVTSVEVNGVTATVRPDGTFTAIVPVVPGTNLLHAVAKDAQGNKGKETRAVVAGPTQAIDRTIERALTMSISAQTFDALGRGASTFVATAELTPMVTPMNPIVDMGTTNGQPDCLYGQAFATFVDVGAADIRLIPQSGGLLLDATLDNVRTDMFLRWAVSCLNGSRNVRATASRIRVRGTLGAGVDAAGNIRFKLSNPSAQVTNFNVDMGGVPQTIIDLLSLDTRLGPVLAWATERFVAPMLDDALANLSQTKTLEVFGKQIDATIVPTRLDFDPTGAIIELDSELRARGDSGQVVFVPNSVPAMDRGRGFQLAIADDAANQLLASLWSAKAMEARIDLTTGPYGPIGQLYDAVEISAAVPPFVDATREGLRLTVGDLIATFKNGDAVATQVAVNAQLDLVVTADATGALRLDVGQPKVFVDIIDENIDGANSLSTSDFEAITSFALSRVVSFGSGAVGAIPLPAAGGVAMKNVSVGPQTGYLVVDGEIQ